MLRHFTLIAILLLPIVSSAQRSWNNPRVRASQEMATESREIKDNYKGLLVTDGIEVEMSYGSSTSLDIRANANLLKHLKTKVNDDGVLVLTLKKGSYSGKISIQIKLVAGERPTFIKVTDGSTLVVNDPIDQADLKLKVTDSARLELGGKVRDLEAVVTDSANIRAYGLRADNCEAKATDGARLEVSVSYGLAAKVTDGARISYKGNPKLMVQKSDGGRVVKAND